MKILEIITQEKEQFRYFFIFSIAGAIIFGILNYLNPLIFKRFLGNSHPLLVYIICFIAGFFSFIYLLEHSDLVIFRDIDHTRILWTYPIAVVLAVMIIIFVDLRGGYSREINVLFPESVIFYPAIGFIAEILFHMIPVTLGLLVTSIFFPQGNNSITVISILLFVSIIEPVYQQIFGSVTGWFAVYQTIHILIINIIQLFLFCKYDFVSMFSFRLVYYFLWHILWGYFRLKIL